MADTSSLAGAIYPNLPSATTPAPEAAPAPAAGSDQRSAAEKIYGETPADGVETARAIIDSGKARPASEVAAEAEAAERGEVIGEFGLAPGPLADKFSGLAKEAGLSRENATKMVALHHEVSTTYWNDQGAAWEKQSRAQFGSQLPAMVRDVQHALNDPSLTPPAFKNLLSTYRIGSNPIVI